jgi:hypothetical protein
LEAPDNGTQIPFALDSPGYFKLGFAGKRNQVKGITYPEEFPEKRPDKIIAGFKIRVAHAGGSIQEYHKIHGTVRLARRGKNKPQD